MSRLGKMPIKIPAGVEVKPMARQSTLKGQKGPSAIL
jgi:ribosomal protein L6P/L9E